MVKKAAASRTISRKKNKPDLPVVNKQNIGQIEDETIHRVTKTLSSLEVAISTWDASKEKPIDLKLKYMKYRWLHEALSGWERKVLTNKGKANYPTRMGHLQEFVTICNSYANG